MTDNDNNRTVPNALPVGYRFNEFEIKEVIGGGGFGIVYRAWDHQLERTIAIKEFMPSSLAVRGDDMTLCCAASALAKRFPRA
jgi:serine/threonine protein kinase